MWHRTPPVSLAVLGDEHDCALNTAVLEKQGWRHPADTLPTSRSTCRGSLLCPPYCCSQLLFLPYQEVPEALNHPRFCSVWGCLHQTGGRQAMAQQLSSFSGRPPGPHAGDSGLSHHAWARVQVSFGRTAPSSDSGSAAFGAFLHLAHSSRHRGSGLVGLRASEPPTLCLDVLGGGP